MGGAVGIIVAENNEKSWVCLAWSRVQTECMVGNKTRGRKGMTALMKGKGVYLVHSSLTLASSNGRIAPGATQKAMKQTSWGTCGLEKTEMSRWSSSIKSCCKKEGNKLGLTCSNGDLD